MFDALSTRLQDVFQSLKGETRLTPETVEAAMREIRLALLEADVNFQVVKDFVERLREQAMGQEVMRSLTPGQQVVKIVRDELGAEHHHLVAIVQADHQPLPLEPRVVEHDVVVEVDRRAALRAHGLPVELVLVRVGVAGHVLPRVTAVSERIGPRRRVDQAGVAEDPEILVADPRRELGAARDRESW